jgi:hypothetical protein
MRRRDFITIIGSGAIAWPLTARAQQPAMSVIGFINAASPQKYAQPLSAFLKGLGETGYVDGRNCTSNIAGRRAKIVDCRRWRPISFIARWP